MFGPLGESEVCANVLGQRELKIGNTAHQVPVVELNITGVSLNAALREKMKKLKPVSEVRGALPEVSLQALSTGLNQGKNFCFDIYYMP